MVLFSRATTGVEFLYPRSPSLGSILSRNTVLLRTTRGVGGRKYLCLMSTAAALEKKENHSRLLHWKNVTNRPPYRPCPHILPPAEFLIVSIHSMYIAVSPSWMTYSILSIHSPSLPSPSLVILIHCLSMGDGWNWNKDAARGGGHLDKQKLRVVCVRPEWWW